MLVNSLIAAGANLNVQPRAYEHYGTCTALLVCWSTNNVMQALISAGANVDIRNQDGRSALFWSKNHQLFNNIYLKVFPYKSGFLQ